MADRSTLARAAWPPRRTAIEAGGVAIAIVVLWCFVYGRTTPSAMGVPILYESDAWSLLAHVKVASEGWLTPLSIRPIPSLNAPSAANWNDYPRPNKLLFWLLGQAARHLGLFESTNLALLLAHVLAGVCFYGVARYLRWRREWAAAFSLVFAWSHYIGIRGIEHLALSFYWHIPLCILVIAWAFKPGGLGTLHSPRLKLALVVGAITALQSIYYAALFGAFLIMAVVSQLLRRRRHSIFGPLVVLGLLLAIGVADMASSFVYANRHGRNAAAVERGFVDLEAFALRPVELVLAPPGRGLGGWGTIVQAYWRGGLRGEGRAVYLGLVGVAGLGLVVAGPLGSWLARRRRYLPGSLLAVVSVCAFSIVGGVNTLVALGGLPLLRGTNRYSVWILTLSILCLGGTLSRLVGSRSRTFSLVTAAVLTVVAMVDQVPPFVRARDVAVVRSRVDSDEAFVRSLERQLPQGAMLFMLPVLDYPEVPPVNKLRDYEHFRPFFFSSTLRFSYGTDKGRPSNDWQRRVSSLPPGEMTQELERLGFAGIILNRRGYADTGRGLLGALQALGRVPAAETPDLVFVPVRTSTRP